MENCLRDELMPQIASNQQLQTGKFRMSSVPNVGFFLVCLEKSVPGFQSELGIKRLLET